MKSPCSTLLIAVIILSGCKPYGVESAGSRTEHTTTVRRSVNTPSGDWGGSIDYVYGGDDKLLRASYEFHTFSGYDSETDAFRPTRAIRKYEVAEPGKLILKAETMTGITTGQLVHRTFYEPKISHWLTLAQAWKGIQAEAATSGGDLDSN